MGNEMTNQEKAEELLYGYGQCCKDECMYIALKMAKWKDNQFKTRLRYMRSQLADKLSNKPEDSDKNENLILLIAFLNKIINEFFKEN